MSLTTGNGATTLTVVSPVVRNMRTMVIGVNGTTTVSSVSGGGVTAWNLATALTAQSSRLEIWWGQVDNTATAPTTLTVAWATAIGSTYAEFTSQMWQTDRLRPRWFLSGAGNVNSASGTTLTWPTLTPASGSELFLGQGWDANTGSVGLTAGFTWSATAGNNQICYDTATTAAATPTATQSPTGYWLTAGALFGVTEMPQPATPQAVWRANSY